MTKILRTPTRAEGGITDDERSAMAEHVRLWTSRAFRTDEIDPKKIIPAIDGIYRAAGLPVVPVIVVPSPLVMVLAGGIASAWWELRMGGAVGPSAATRDATRYATHAATRYATFAATRNAARYAADAATRDATRDATRYAADAATRDATRYAADAATRDATRDAADAADAATRAATRYATYLVTHAATRNAADSATETATRAATRDAADAATRDATYDATRDAADSAFTATSIAAESATYAATDNFSWLLPLTDSFVGAANRQLALDAIREWYTSYQGGNMWAATECYITAMRDIIGLRLPEHEAYAHWEKAAIHGGYRFMHKKFCMVCDFPEILKIDDQNRPHAEGGPSHRWRDGWSLHYLHGIKVEPWMAETPAEKINAIDVLKIENVDQRREVIRRVGMERIAQQLEPEVLDTVGEYQLLAIDMQFGEPWRFLRMKNPSIDAIHVEAVPRECETVQHALNWRRYGNINKVWSPSQLQ